MVLNSEPGSNMALCGHSLIQGSGHHVNLVSSGLLWRLQETRLDIATVLVTNISRAGKLLQSKNVLLQLSDARAKQHRACMLLCNIRTVVPLHDSEL